MVYIRLFALVILFVGSNNAFSQNKLKQANLVYVDKTGVLRFTKDKSEAAFFGVNYTVPFAYGYRSINALHKDIRKEIDNDVYHLARIGVDAFRVHVWDTEISDSLGNLLNNEHLQLFDYLVAQLEKRNIRIIITPVAFWGNGYPEKDERTPGFSRVFGKGRANVNDTAIRAQENYVKQLFTHVNTYTNSTYTNDKNVIAVEINNEPSHSGPKSGVTSYINRMAAAIRSVGWTKPLFYNISQNPYYADAVAASGVNGFSFQWYPTGLVAGHEVAGNFLPNVDRYAIPYDTIPSFHNKAKMVYEFDAADLLQSNMYPAMARSYRSAGFQWATQFAYDPMATAYGNTEYQTHYLNLAYTPSKAISLLIASRAFHTLPRLKTYGSYPTDSSFDVFRVSYKNSLSEMNAADEFYYSNSTASHPVNPSRLQHVAGVGSSSVVHYDGSGAYFLDKLEDGIWRLEVMPDAISIRDPFEKASPKKEVTRIQWQANAMQILLPDLAAGLNIKAINDGNSYAAIAANNGFKIQPGTYLISAKGKEQNKWTANSTTGVLKLGEFVAPQPFDTTPFLVYHPVQEAPSGKPFTITAKAVGLDLSDKVSLQLNVGWQSRNIPMQSQNGYDYGAEIPANMLTPGILSYRLVVEKGSDYYSYPGNYKGDPFAWDYINNEAYKLTVTPANSALSLFNAATDPNILTYPVFRRGLESKLVTTLQPGQMVYRIAVTDLTADRIMGLQTYFGDKLKLYQSTLSNFKTVVVRARTTSPQLVKAKLTFITKDALPFAATLTLTPAFADIEIPISSLQKDSMLLLPRPYPDFMPLWFTPSGEATFSLMDAEKLQITVGADALPNELNKPFSVEVESVWLKK